MRKLVIDESNIGKVNLLVTLFLVLLFAFAFIYSSIVFKKEHYEKLKGELQEKFIHDKKLAIKADVLKVNKLLMSNLQNLDLSLEEKQNYIQEAYKNLNKINPKQYFFVYKLEKQEDDSYIQKVLVHPYVTKGKILNINRKDLNGNKFVKTFQDEVLKNGSTFLDYSYIHPKTKKEVNKIGFFIKNEWNWVIGSGFFLSDVENELNMIEIKIKKNINEELSGYLGITLFFLLILIFFILSINKFTTKTINKFKKQVDEERKKLIQSQDYLTQYTNILENSTIVSKTDINGLFTYVSKSFCEIMGYKKEELIGHPFSLLNHPDYEQSFFDDMCRLLENKKSFRSEIKNLSKDGKTLYFVIIISPILDSKGNILELVSYRFDITKELELKKVLENQNKELIKSEKILNEAQRIAHIGNWEYNVIENKISFSDEAKRIFGLDESIKDLDFEEFKKVIYKEDLEKIKNNKNFPLNENNQYYFEHRILKDDETIGYVEVKGEYLYDENNVLIKAMGTVNDISERRNSEAELKQKDIMLLQQSKMAAMGEMLSNIAHQWRQPLSLISTTATGAKLQREIGVLSEEKLDEALSSINNTVQYLSSTIDDFRNFFKPDNEKTEFRIVEILDKAIELVKPQFKNRDIEIMNNIEDFEIFGLENEFLQVIINILNNARDQLMKIDTKRVIIISSSIEDEDYIIKIKDNGNGIKEDIIDRIFEPYFTTKHSSEGTGIGLYMSEEIITKHMLGKIIVKNTSFSINNENYFGAEFIIKLPK